VKRGRDLVALVGNDAALDVVTVSAQQLLERVAAPVLRLAARHAVGDGQHRRFHSFVFSTSVISLSTMPLSIAFAMS